LGSTYGEENGGHEYEDIDGVADAQGMGDEGPEQCCCDKEEPSLSYVCLPNDLTRNNNDMVPATVCRSHIYSPTFFSRAKAIQKIPVSDVKMFATATAHDGKHLNATTHKRELVLQTLSASFESWNGRSSHCEDTGSGSHVEEGGPEQATPLKAYRLFFKDDIEVIPAEIINGPVIAQLNGYVYESLTEADKETQGRWMCEEWQQTASMDDGKTNLLSQLASGFKGHWGEAADKPRTCRVEQKCTKWRWFTPCGWKDGEDKKYSLFKLVGRADGECTKLKKTIFGYVCPDPDDFTGHIGPTTIGEAMWTVLKRQIGVKDKPGLHWCVCPSLPEDTPAAERTCASTRAGNMAPVPPGSEKVFGSADDGKCPENIEGTVEVD